MSSSNNNRPKTCNSNINLIITNTITETNSISIQDLPNELLFVIFLYLPSEQVLLTIPQVCQRWSDLHYDTCLYRHLTFKDNVPDTKVAVQLINMATGLKSLIMAFRKDTDEILRHVAISNPLLETFKLRDCRGTTYRYNVLAIRLRNVIKHCPKLRSLSLKHTWCNSKKLYSDIGDRLPLLNAVDFGPSCSEVELFNNADKFRKLSYLRIFSSDNVVTRYCRNHSGSLTTAKLDFCTCTDASLIPLGTCQLLKTLYVERAFDVTDMGIMEISKLPNLKKVHISCTRNVTSPCWIRFFQTPNMKRIKNLSLDSCENVNDDVAIAIVQNLSDLQMLSLQIECDSDITDIGIMEISNLANLEVLHISYADEITSECWIRFFQTPHMKRIKNLSLDSCENVNADVAIVITHNLSDLQMLSLQKWCSSLQKFVDIRQTLPQHCLYNF